jgi:hypothetical protein
VEADEAARRGGEEEREPRIEGEDEEGEVRMEEDEEGDVSGACGGRLVVGGPQGDGEGGGGCGWQGRHGVQKHEEMI